MKLYVIQIWKPQEEITQEILSLFMHNANSYSWVKNYPGEITMHAKMLVEDPALKTFYYLNKYDAHVFAEMFPPFSWCSETTG